MERNQFYNCGNQIIKIERATKRKSAYVTIAIPDDACEDFINSIIDIQKGKNPNICGLQLSWINKDLAKESNND